MSIVKAILALAVTGIMMLAGLNFGLNPGKFVAGTNLAAGNEAPARSEPALSTGAASNGDFYLSDYKTGYSDGYEAGSHDRAGAAPATDREGYNEGFKRGFADGYSSRQAEPAQPSFQRESRRISYRQEVPVRRRGSKFRTAMTIAAPAAIGAGIGVLAGGKKGAAAGALIGGGGGALYHLYRNRNR